MKRYGPLIAVRGALAIGDPGRHHLRLAPEGVSVWNHVDSTAIHAWDDVSLIDLDLPTTRFRYPGLVGTIGLGILSAAAADTLGIDPDDAGADLVIRGEPVRVTISRHHVGGYWVRSVIGAQRLIDHLLSHPDQRPLLRTPQALVETAARLARR